MQECEPMRVSIVARLWCDPRSGACEVEERIGPAECSGRHICIGTVLVAQCDVDGQFVFVVNDGVRPGLDGNERATLTEILLKREKAVVAFVREASTGRCNMAVMPPTSTPDGRGAAARAAAVVQASWGWDESPEILVSVDNEVIEVAPRYGTLGWSAGARMKGL
jgi:hypothetical protein